MVAGHHDSFRRFVIIVMVVRRETACSGFDVGDEYGNGAL
jgi:hypothetical protein